MPRSLFVTNSALWAGLVIELPSPCVCVYVSVCMCHCKKTKGHIANFGLFHKIFLIFFLQFYWFLALSTCFLIFLNTPLWISLLWIMGKLGGEGLWLWSLLLVTSDIWRMKRDIEQVTDGRYFIVLLLLCASVERVRASRMPEFFLNVITIRVRK